MAYKSPKPPPGYKYLESYASTRAHAKLMAEYFQWTYDIKITYDKENDLFVIWGKEKSK
jgi:hypothetical protein